MQDVKVGVVLLLHETSEFALLRGAEIAERVDVLDAGFLEHAHALGKLQAERRPEILERLVRELLRDNLELVRETLVETVEHVSEEVIEHVEHLEEVFLDGHLHVEAGELAQVAMGVGILGAKHRANLEHALEIDSIAICLYSCGDCARHAGWPM